MQITVVIPTYNRPDFLKKAIESVLQQTFQDFTIFISDNASTKETAEVVNNFNDNRIIYHRHIENIGMQGNWKFCLENAPGNNIALLEDDNYFLPNHLSDAASLMLKHDIQFYSCNSKLNDELYTNIFSETIALKKEEIRIANLLLDIRIPASGVVFSKGLLKHINFAMAKDLWCMDRFYWRSMILHTGLIFNPAVNIIYVVHKNNITHSLLNDFRSRAKASAQNRFVDRYILFMYTSMYPSRILEIVDDLLKRNSSDLQYILPSFYSSEKNQKLFTIGNLLLEKLYLKKKVPFFKYLPDFLSAFLIKKINSINSLIGNWEAPKVHN
ncbi:MAG: glycosyltransferase family 2 protein [Sediminibacterium sp.]|nr:glycosyltransferase family 2 protein [Sediminibacterium sp.]